MQPEHEEAMRREFTDQVELGRNMFRPSVTEAELDRIEQQHNEVDQRWRSGPHAEHWEYLDDAHHDWSQRPDTMRRFVDGVSYDRAAGHTEGMTDIQYRSQLQARDLTEVQRARERDRPQRSR